MNNPYLVTAGQPLQAIFAAEAISANTRAVNEELSRLLSKIQPPGDLPGLRDAYIHGELGLPASPKSPRARTVSITGPGGPIELRILVPDVVRGVYLHVHGGGWIVGNNETWDQQLELLGREAGMVTVSVNYRLAPEHPFPAAIDDCLAAAAWLIENGKKEFGTSWFAIGGESAGANLTASTLVRLRDMGQVDAFRAANLLFGCFDLSLTPSVWRAKGTPFVTLDIMKQFTALFAGQTDLRDPAISPLYADLRGLPPALFTVGTIDPLVDDTLFMHTRWQTAGNISYLAVYPGGIHGFNSLQGDLATAANLGMARFLAEIRRQAD